LYYLSHSQSGVDSLCPSSIHLGILSHGCITNNNQHTSIQAQPPLGIPHNPSPWPPEFPPPSAPSRKSYPYQQNTSTSSHTCSSPAHSTQLPARDPPNHPPINRPPKLPNNEQKPPRHHRNAQETHRRIPRIVSRSIPFPQTRKRDIDVFGEQGSSGSSSEQS
jgi:hypothetical protein